MDVKGMRTFAGRHSARSTRLAIAGCVLLAVPILWTIRQSRLTREALDRADAAEKAVAQARTDAEEARAQVKTAGKPRKDPALRRTRHDDPGEIERVKQLYDEIDSLTRIRDQVEEQLSGERWTVTRKTAPGKTPAAPARKP
jgi:hypothetical protein